MKTHEDSRAFPCPWESDYNVTPDSMQPVIWRNRETGERELAVMRWGIVPCFAKTEIEFKKLSTINLKSDRLTDSKMWRDPFAKAPMFGTDPKEGIPVPQFYDQPAKPEAELTGSGDLFSTPLKAPKTTFLLPQLIETIRTVDSNRNRQALRYPIGDKGYFIAEIPLLYLPISL
jgi:hypothetical protein